MGNELLGKDNKVYCPANQGRRKPNPRWCKGIGCQFPGYCAYRADLKRLQAAERLSHIPNTWELFNWA